MALHIAHLYANTDNLGDWGSAEGVKLMLREEFDHVTFSDFHLSFKDLSAADIQNINEKCDIVVVGGGGLLYPRSKGLLLHLSQTTLSLIKKPIVLFAIGLNFEPADEHLVKNYLEQFKKAASLFAYISVRDIFTQRILKSHDIDTHLTPCPSMFLEKSSALFSLPESKKEYVGIVPIPLERFEKNYRTKYLSALRSFIKENANHYSFCFIGHNKNVGGIYETLFSRIQIPIINPVNPWQLMRTYDQMSYVVGSRGHMGIFALGAVRPFIFLSYNIKCDAFTDQLNYPSRYTITNNNFNEKHLTNEFMQLTRDTKQLKFLFEKKCIEYRRLNKIFMHALSIFISSI